MAVLTARVCKKCGKPLGVFAFRLPRERGYWHPRCFSVIKRKSVASETTKNKEKE